MDVIKTFMNHLNILQELRHFNVIIAINAKISWYFSQISCHKTQDSQVLKILTKFDNFFKKVSINIDTGIKTCKKFLLGFLYDFIPSTSVECESLCN